MVVEEEYNDNHTRLTGWDVSVGDDSDIIEWVNGKWTEDDDGYMTLVSVVKSDNNDAQLVYIWKFDPDYRTRDITVTLDGDVLGTQRNMWWSDDDIVVNYDAITDLANQGYTFTYSYTYGGKSYNGTVSGSDWKITNIPAGYDDITINITSKHVDILTIDNMTLDTMDAHDGKYDPYAGNIWTGSSSTIFYNFVLNDEGEEIADVSWTETVYVDYGDGNKQVSSLTKHDVPDGKMRVEGQTTADYTANDEVTVVISDLKVTLKAEEPVVSDVTVESVTLARGTEENQTNTMSGTITMSANVSGYAFVQLQVREGNGEWTDLGEAVRVAFSNNSATFTVNDNIVEEVAGTLYRVVVTNADELTDGTDPVVFEYASTGIR